MDPFRKRTGVECPRFEVKMAPIRFTIALLSLWCPVTWASDNLPDDLDEFLLEGEINRAALEADKAPKGDIFLDDEDEEAAQWAVPEHLDDEDDMEDDPDEDFDLIEDEEDDLDEASSSMPFDDFGEDPPENGDGAGLALSPFADNYPLKIVQREMDSIVVELPILIANGGMDFDSAGVWIIADVMVNGHRVAQNRQLVTKEAVAELGATHVWVKAAAPIDGPEASVEVRVSKTNANGSRTEPLFSRSVAIRM